MSKLHKLNTLKKFLDNHGFYLEASACSNLIKLAIPTGMFGDEYFSVKKTDLERHGIHGWVYILKTAPRKDGTAPLAWYVGSSTAPERRFMEHAFSSTPVETFPSESGVGAVMMGASGFDSSINYSPESFSQMRDTTHRSSRPISDSYYDIKSPTFTKDNLPLEVVCVQVVYRTPETDGLTNAKALRIKEKEVFTKLAQFVGGKNIGGDKAWMDTVIKGIKTNDIQTSPNLLEPSWESYEDHISYQKSVSAYENEVKSYIVDKFGCESSVDGEYENFAGELNNLEWSNFIDKDFAKSIGLDNLAKGEDKRRRDFAEEWIADKLQPLTNDRRLLLEQEITNLLIFEKDVVDKESLIEAINLQIPYLSGIDEFSLAKLEKGFGFSFRPYFKFKGQRDLVIKALRENSDKTQAAAALYNYEKADMAEERGTPRKEDLLGRLNARMRVLQISEAEHLGKDLEYIRFAESGEKIYKSDIEKALRCASSVNEASRFFGRDKSNNRTFSRYIYKLLYPDLTQEEQKRMIKEEYLSKESLPEDREWAKERGFVCFNPNPSREELLEALFMSNGSSKGASDILNSRKEIIDARRREEGLGAVAFKNILKQKREEEKESSLELEDNNDYHS